MLEVRDNRDSLRGDLLAVATEPLADLVSRCRRALVAGNTVQAELLAELYARRHPEAAPALREAGQREMARREPQVAAVLFRASLAAFRADGVHSDQRETDDFKYHELEAERLQSARRIFDPLADNEFPVPSNQKEENRRTISGASKTMLIDEHSDTADASYFDGLDVLPLDELVDLEAAADDSDDDAEAVDGDDLLEALNAVPDTGTNRHAPPVDNFDLGLFEDDLYELDEAPTREELQALVAVDGVVPRHRRALQAAAELAADHDLGPDGLELLAEIFEQHGWASSRRAVDRELALGCTAEELRRAHDLRGIWAESGEFGIAAVGHNYHFLTWPLALQIVRSFRGYPDLEEMVEFLDEALIEWKSHHASSPEQYQRLEYPAFRDFVRAKVDCSLSSDFCNPIQALGDAFGDEDPNLPAGGISTLDRDLADLGVIYAREESVAHRVGIVVWHPEALPRGHARRVPPKGKSSSQRRRL